MPQQKSLTMYYSATKYQNCSHTPAIQLTLSLGLLRLSNYRL